MAAERHIPKCKDTVNKPKPPPGIRNQGPGMRNAGPIGQPVAQPRNRRF